MVKQVLTVTPPLGTLQVDKGEATTVYENCMQLPEMQQALSDKQCAFMKPELRVSMPKLG